MILSRFLHDSDLSRLADGRLSLDEADRSVREVLTRCADLRRSTDGSFEFEPRRHRGDPSLPLLDPNAFAKGWIVQEAAAELRLAGAAEYFVNAGGDMLVHRPHPSNPYRVGIQQPSADDPVVAVLEVLSGAVATSGTYERGAHIRGARGELASVTVVGPDLGEADGLATAVFAGGLVVPPWWPRAADDFGLLTVTNDRELRWLPPTSDSLTRRNFLLSTS